MIPLTAVLRYNFAPDGFLNPYVGAGAAYVLFDNLSDASDFGNLNLRSIDFKDDAGLALNAGVMLSLGKSVALVVDGKYVPLESSATAVYAPNGATSETRVKINPVIFSGGISFRF
jgi:outer membrane protein W